MKSQISRLFAWGLAALAGGAFGFVPGIVREKENRRDERNGAIIALKGKMAEDENASNIAIAAVLRETTGHREVKDEAEAALKESEEKLEFLQAEEEKVGKEIEETEKEGIDLGQVRLDVQAKVADTKIRLEPLQRNADELAAQRKALEEELAGVRMGNQTLQTQLDKLVAKRDEILVDFREREKFYRKTIKIPPWFYYGDKFNLAVTNARPSGTGVFLPIGIENGVKGGMEFLARRIDPTAPGRRSRHGASNLHQFLENVQLLFRELIKYVAENEERDPNKYRQRRRLAHFPIFKHHLVSEYTWRFGRRAGPASSKEEN